MPLKYENEVAEAERMTPIESPLYGENYTPPRRLTMKEERNVDPRVLGTREVLDALKYAESIYYQELVRHGYSPLTVGSYSSAVGRFIQFLEFGQVIPNREQ